MRGKMASADAAFRYCGQAEARDVEAHAERRQLDDGTRVAEPELADQVRRKSLGVAERVGICDRLLVAAAVGSFAGESDVGEGAGARRSLIAIAEEQPVLVAEVLVRPREPLVRVA